MRVAFDPACGSVLRNALIAAAACFQETTPDAADAIVFDHDIIADIEASDLYRRFPAKCIAITETDTPTFRLPGLYAANARSFITDGRTRTVNYFLSERVRANPEVRALIGTDLEKTYLYSFMGGSNSWARKSLFRAVASRADTLIEPTDHYNHWTTTAETAAAKQAQMRRYAQVLGASKFALCPRGCGLSSYRLFESMSLGIAPVIISDAWRPVSGIDWSFAIFIREDQISRIDGILRHHEPEWRQRGATARQIYQASFQPDIVAKLLHTEITAVLAGYNPSRELAMARITKLRGLGRAAYWRGYGVAKHAVLWGFYMTGRQVPIRLNRPVEVQINRSPKK